MSLRQNSLGVLAQLLRHARMQEKHPVVVVVPIGRPARSEIDELTQRGGLRGSRQPIPPQGPDSSRGEDSELLEAIKLPHHGRSGAVQSARQLAGVRFQARLAEKEPKSVAPDQ